MHPESGPDFPQLGGWLEAGFTSPLARWQWEQLNLCFDGPTNPMPGAPDLTSCRFVEPTTQTWRKHLVCSGVQDSPGLVCLPPGTPLRSLSQGLQ